MATVVLKNVIKRFGKAQVIHNVDLAIEDREFMVLVGPSGCGKSTILRMIAGLETISSGTIAIGDQVVNDLAPKDRHIAMVFQNYALYPHMNVFENMSFGLRLKKTPPQEIEQRVRAAAEILGLTDLLHRKPFELSGGQRQRVAMGRAIVRNPSVFLFDEPLSNLDAKLRTQMRAEIKLLHQRVHATVIYVTHDQIEAMTLADRIVVLRDGRIEQIGKPLELFHHPVNTFVAGFIGSPPMNLVEGRLGLSESRIVFAGGVAFPIRMPKERVREAIEDGQAVVCGIRPEDMTLSGVQTGWRHAFDVQGQVQMVEPLGSETYVHVRIGDAVWVGRCEGRLAPHIGDAVTMTVNTDHIHVFDAASRGILFSTGQDA